MNDSSQSPSTPELGEVMITTALRSEHRILRAMMEAMAGWLAKAPATASIQMRERMGPLYLALETHAQREEQHLFAQLRPLSARAQHLVDRMILVHDEVRDLFEELEGLENPKEHIWTILDLTETHFDREDEEVFPLAEELMPRQLLCLLAEQGYPRTN